MKIALKTRLQISTVFTIFLLIVFMPPGARGDYYNYVEIFSPAMVGQEDHPERITSAAVPGSMELINIALGAVTSPAEKFKHVRLSFRQGALSLSVHRYDMVWADDGSLAWYGRIEEDGGSVLFSVFEDAVFGLIESVLGVYKIEPAGNGSYWIYEVDFSKADKFDAGGIVPPVPYEIFGVEEDEEAEVAAKTTVTILVIYTNGFKAAYPGAQLNAQINFLIGVTNTSYNNSKVKLQLKVVRKKKRRYTDEGTLLTPLNDLTDGKGVFKKVNNWRNKFKADVVTLLRVKKPSNNGFCGLAWTMTVLSAGFAPFAYSVVQVGRYTEDGWTYFCYDSTLAHEIGHNMGSNHNKGDIGVFPYSLGHRFVPGQYMTLMSYAANGEQAVNYWSNPKVDYLGHKTGTPKLNNGKSLKKVKKTVAKWRQ